MPEIDHNSTTLDAPISHRLKELAWVFTKLGIIGFGGPAAHIAMIEAEVVTRRQWLSRDQLIDLLGITNLLPGPNSTEVVIHIGLLRAGWRGLVVAGVCFILPAMLLVWGLAIGYGQYQTLPQVEAMLYGIKPVIIGMIAQAVWKLGNSVLKGRFMVLITALLLGLIFLQVHEILLLIIAGLLVVGWEALRTKYQLSISPSHTEHPSVKNSVDIVEHTSEINSKINSETHPKTTTLGNYAPWFALPILPLGLLQPITNFVPRPEAWAIFAIFLQIGFVLYGGGYVLFAFLQQQLVERSHWLTSQQLIDAIAIGQFTPGPLFTTATFIGYLLAGHGGAVGATVGIFLPAFICVGLVSPLVPYLRRSLITSRFLNGVNCGALALMISVVIDLGQAVLVNGILWLVAAITWLILYRYPKLNAVFLLLGGALFGMIYRAFSHY